ncbi:hydrogenase iron-sulfur subunit [Natronobacterium gregoryi]|uniref:Coenzyme F420-reducing hydrogenase, delta subunit n=3 Tax=cellular organisms TaxID=131567 RepID=L0ALD2_NATGS|nr:hydrogenase iron-sulfur subunit [Natronobacterium gregoryi]AFZ74002.1 coenzyme F420-reducing hydrogenase, delta subunit [Natronobacterium gregoryi SP2]ELY70574.1 F420-non-reducing hydrogenase vhc iron-sulfur subunit D [Natronobacterium gregoryi SP2]PLK20751.1 hydrogenase iron-sulfur subunit [Natronobacterium gregoryi SP2]SFJ08017.1 F420-non-reducing hydrogenase iron-sulfur subunit [Natronobacterium gregoryi]
MTDVLEDPDRETLESVIESEATDPATEEWTPLVVAFLCNWCSYEGAQTAGGARKTVPANVFPVRVMCSGRVDYDLVAKTLTDGADGILVLGCHEGDCHYKTGNYLTRKRHALFTAVLQGLGVHEDRVRLDWVSADEGERYATVTREMAARVRELGPLADGNSGPTTEVTADGD